VITLRVISDMCDGAHSGTASAELHGLWQQHPLETDLVRTCYNCGVTLGTLHCQLSAACGGPDRDISTPACPPSPTPSCPGLAAGTPEIACPYGCGVPYCSRECIDVDGRRGHQLLCVGGVATEAHPLFQFKVMVYDRGGFDAYMLLSLAARCVAADLMKPGFFGLGERDLATVDAWSGTCDDRASSADLLVECWALLSEALRERATALNLPLLQANHTAEWWARVVGTIHRHHVEVATSTSAIDYCKTLTSTAPPDVVAAVEGVLFDLGLIRSQTQGPGGTGSLSLDGNAMDSVLDGPGAEIDGADDCAESSADSAATDGDRADDSEEEEEEEEEEDELPSFRQLVSQPAHFLPGRNGLVYFSKLAGLPHCCVPSVAASFARTITPAHKVTRIDDVGVDAECWSRVPTEFEYNDRREALRSRGLTCRCSRCAFEQSEVVVATGIGGPDGSIDPVAVAVAEAAVIRRIALLAEDDGRHIDAVTAWARVVRLLPQDADARYHEARAMGWADMWAESHRLLKRAALDFPDHAEINEALTAGKVYSCKPNRVVDVMTNAFIADHFDTMSLEPADMADASSNTVYTSRSPMLDPHECALAVAAVEAHVAQIGNWSTSRHYR
jgi:hypothetical protein